MKNAILLFFLFMHSVNAQAFEMQKVLYNYVIPCAASFVAGSLVDSSSGQNMGIVVCTGISTFSLMQDLSDSRAASMNDVNKMAALVKAHNERIGAEITKDLGGKIEQLTKDRQSFMLELREQIQRAVSDQSTFMSEQMAERLKTAMSSPDFIPDLMERINLRVKSEVASEYDMRREEIVRQAVADVLNSVTVKAVPVPEGRRVDPDKKTKANSKAKQTKYEDEE